MEMLFPNKPLVDSNPFILGTDTLRFDTQPGTDPGNFSFLSTFANVINGHYDSMQASLTKRPTRSGFFGDTFFSMSWTWAHELNNADGFAEYNSSVPAYNWRQFYASGDNDIRHRVVFSGGWDLPIGRSSSNTFVKYALHGWTVFPIFSFRTGFPLDIASGLVADGATPGPSGAGDPDLVRPNLVGSGVATFDPHRAQNLGGTTGSFYFNPANFALPSSVPGNYTYGALGRNAFRGPTRTNLDLAISKRTPLFRERVVGEFRAEAFNVFNHTLFDDPQLNIQSGTFGQISTTGGPRILQLALRIVF